MDYDLRNVETGQVVSGRCKAYRCAYCGPRKLWLTEHVLAYSNPQRMVTLTLAPADRKRRRDQVSDFVRRVRGEGYVCELAWVTEANPRGTGHHIHALQRGDFIPQRLMQARWGNRIVHVSKVRGVGEASAYVIKNMAGSMRAAGYVMKETDEWRRVHDNAERVRPVNITRKYFGGKTLEQMRAETKEQLFPDDVDDLARWERVGRRSRGSP